MTVTAILRSGQKIKSVKGEWEITITVPRSLHESLYKSFQTNNAKEAK